MKNAMMFLLLTVTSVAWCQNADIMQAQKMCYDQAALVEAPYITDALGKLSWNNHYDARTKTCWVLDMTPLLDMKPWHVMVRVINPFNKDLPDAEFMGYLGADQIDPSKDICKVHGVRCLNSFKFEELISIKYGFPEQATLGMAGLDWWLPAKK